MTTLLRTASCPPRGCSGHLVTRDGGAAFDERFNAEPQTTGTNRHRVAAANDSYRSQRGGSPRVTDGRFTLIAAVQTTADRMAAVGRVAPHCSGLRLDLLQPKGDCHEHINRHGFVTGTVEQREIDRPEAAVEAKGNLGDTRAPAAIVPRAPEFDS